MDTLTKYNHIPYEEISFGEEIDKGNLIVYKGVYNNNMVAIKEYLFEKDNIDTDLLNELQIGSKVRSERMLKVIGYSISKENIYLIMEYINSTCLWDFIDNDKYYETVIRSNGEFVYDYQGWVTNYIMTYELKKSIIISVLKSIKSMYNDRIIHGDLKTPNLVVHKNGDEKFIKVIDYGSCYYGNTNIDIDRVVGTDGYYAPEQIEGLLNHKSDIYSTGVIMTEVYVGKIWKGANNFNSCRNELLKSLRMIKKENPKLEKLIRKSIDLDHKKRPDIYKLYDDFINL